MIVEQREKINALQEFLFRKIFEFDLDGKTITFKIEKQFEPFVKMFAPKFEEILGLKIESKIIKDVPAQQDEPGNKEVDSKKE